MIVNRFLKISELRSHLATNKVSLASFFDVLGPNVLLSDAIDHEILRQNETIFSSLMERVQNFKPSADLSSLVNISSMKLLKRALRSKIACKSNARCYD